MQRSAGRLLRFRARTAALLWIAGAAPVGADTTLTSVFHPPTTCMPSGGTDAGTLPWNNAANARTADNTRADTAIMSAGQGSVYLKCTGFGFTIPAGSVIDGLEMQTERRHPSAGDTIGDRHVFPVRSDGAAIGSTGPATDRFKQPCATNDWGVGTGSAPDTLATYGGAADKWAIVWGACPAGQTSCPGGEYNVNHPNFGVAMAAQNCSTSGSGFAQVDSVAFRATYTIPACGAQAWGTPTVTVADRTPGALTTYTIVTTVPNRGGCALTSASQITITFQSDTNASGVTSMGSGFKETSAAGTTPINPNPVGTLGVQFDVPPAALRPCEGQAQGCLEANTSVTIVLRNVRNPTADANYTLTIAATPTLEGTTGTTTSAPFTIATDCVATSPWGPSTTVMVSEPQASLAASGTTLGCPIFAKYTIATKVPALGGCRLVGGQSKLLLQFPTGTDADAVRITDAKINMTTVMPEATGDVTLVRLPVPMDIANGMDVNVELTVVQNPTTSAATNTVSVRATSPFFSSTGSTGTTNSAPYPINAHTSCPPIDFLVRDWTHKPSNSRDDGANPSSPNSMGEVMPPNCWAECTDVWNQGGPMAPTIPDDDYFVGSDPGLSGSNNAFTRITRKSAAPAIPTYRPVTATYFYSAYGLGLNFQPLGSVTTPYVSSSSQTTILAPLTGWTIPIVPGSSPPEPAVGEHVCVAVQIDSASDPQRNAGIATSDIPGPADPKIREDDNKALRNMNVASVAAPPPPPPPPAPPRGPGPMFHFGIAHNADIRTRDMVIRYDVPQDALRHLREPKIEVIGGEGPTVRPGSTFTLARMRPGESRWIGFNYTLASGADGQLLPVSFTEVDGEKILGAFTFGIQTSPMDAVIRRNLAMHRSIFARMASVFGIPQGKDESAAAAALLKEYSIPDDRYVGHLQRHRGAIEEGVIRLIRAEKSDDPFGLAAALKSFAEGLGAGSAAHAANGHLAFLERLDAFQTMLHMAKGDAADVRQMVWWQKELYTTVPQLKALDVSASIVKESDQFIAGSAKAKPSAYAEHIGRLAKSFRATAEALKKEGVDVVAEAAQLQRPSKSNAALQKAHRAYLLKLDDLAVAAGYAQQPQQQQQKR